MGPAGAGLFRLGGGHHQFVDHHVLRALQHEHHGAGHVLGREHEGPVRVTGHLGSLFQEVAVHIPGTQVTSTDAVVVLLEVQDLRQRPQGRLGGAVGDTGRGRGAPPREGRDQHHRAAPALPHRGQHRVDHGHRAQQIRAGDRGELREVLVGPGAALGIQAGREHHRIHLSQVLLDQCCSRSDRLGVGHVQGHHEGGAAVSLDLRSHLAEHLAAPAGEHYLPARPGGCDRTGPAHPGARSGHPQSPGRHASSSPFTRRSPASPAGDERV